MGGVGNGLAEEDLHWDLNPGAAAMWVGTMRFWGQRGGPFNHAASEAGKQDVAAMQSSLLAVQKNAGEMLKEGKGERTLAGGPGEGATRVWINRRSWQ